jgi:hypothetical protein
VGLTEMGDPVLVAGCGREWERGRAAAGRRHMGPGGTVQTRFELKPKP